MWHRVKQSFWRRLADFLARLFWWALNHVDIVSFEIVNTETGNVEEIIISGGKMLLSNTRKKNLIAHFKDADGNDAKIDGTPTWVSSDLPVATIEPASDGMSAKVVPVKGAVGHTTISVSADADLGDGVRSVVGSIDVDVRAPEATAVAIEEGEEEPNA